MRFGAARALGLTALVLALPAAAQSERPQVLPEDVRYGLLTPLPETGGVPPIVMMLDQPSDEVLAARARAREYGRQIRLIRRRHFGSICVPEIRQAGLAAIREFVDPASFKPLVEELAGEEDDVRLALLDHLAARGDDGQAALAWVAVNDEDDAIRNEALRRMVTPPSLPVLRVLDQTLRSTKHRIANNAGAVAGALRAFETIPLLIFSQATRDPRPGDEGDLAWIAVETQRAYVADLQAVVGDNSGAFLPVVGVVTEGFVLRVMDAVVIVYRTEIHRALVAMTSEAMGESTASLGYDMKAWWEWYNTRYVPYRNEQARLAALRATTPEADGER